MTITIEDTYPSRFETPQMIERKDPVVHSNLEVLPSKNQLSISDCQRFEQEGFLFLEDFFRGNQLEELQNEFHRLVNKSHDYTQKEAVFEPDSNELRSLFNVHRRDPYFSKFWKTPKLYDKAAQILGSETYIHQSRINLKPAFRGKEFYWHSDFETWHMEDGMPRMRAVSCLIALTENNPFNGSLMVMPGSHKTFVSCVGETPANHHLESLRKQEYGVPDDASLKKLADQHGIVSPMGGPGSVLFFDCNIMHGSNSNISPYPRSNIFFVYNSVENKLQDPFCRLKPRPEYIASRDN